MISTFDLFKIGIGPSSSHTMGPMRAAKAFATELAQQTAFDAVARVEVDLFGSLALTGLGHGIDRALILGLEGEDADRVDVESIDSRVARTRAEGTVHLAGGRTVGYRESNDLRLHKTEVLPTHTNGMRFTACDTTGAPILQREYFSIGGGFIVEPGQTAPAAAAAVVPYDFGTAADLLRMCRETNASIADIVLANERAIAPDRDVRVGLLKIWEVMKACARRGLKTRGVLPGGLGVQRRAPGLAEKLRRNHSDDPLTVIDWVSVWAMAVNEENAAGGRVVTAPTNGAAGIVPAVLHYYTEFVEGATDDGVVRFLLTATAVGILCKKNASISGAEIGCQGEVGVACAMAAAGLVASLLGTNDQAERAAEIGIEHHLGMTCDPVAGLVQIPCIERNGVGAVKAVHAARIAIRDDASHIVSLDEVIETMRQTGRDMLSAYKETSLGGLAVNAVDC